MSSHRPATMIDILPDNVLLEIFDHCRVDEVSTSSLLPWKWYRLAHVCRTWRNIIFVSQRRLNLELLCTHRTPVRKNLGLLPALPLAIHFPGALPHFYKDCDKDDDNVIAALEHPDRVHVIYGSVSNSLSKRMVAATQKQFPALTHLRLGSKTSSPVLLVKFLSGCAPRLQNIYLTGIRFPAVPTLLSSCRDLIDVELHDITKASYVSPEAMVAGLAVLPRLKYFTIEFRRIRKFSYATRTRPIIPRKVLPSLTRFRFDGLFEYLEDFVAQIDAPQLDRFEISFLDKVVNYPIPQLCEFIGRSEKFKLALFRHANLRVISRDNYIMPRTMAVELWGRSSFSLSTRVGGTSQVLGQISGMLSDVERLSIRARFWGHECRDDPSGIPWLALLRPFTAVKALSVQHELSQLFGRALKKVPGVGATGVLPALELLCLENQPVTSVDGFVAARRNVGRPVTFINKESEFQEGLETSVTDYETAP